MLNVFSQLKSLANAPKCVTDNNVFRLHYRFTSLVLLGCVILGTASLFGKFIECINNDDFPKDALEAFCWIHSTFSLPGHWNKTVGTEVPYPGVGKHRKGDERVYHKYYQWVYIVLFVQSAFFYLPRYLWKMFECGRIRNLVFELNLPILGNESSTTGKERAEYFKDLLVEYLRSHRGHHKIYLVYHILLEIANFANVVGQMFLINTFLGGEFTSFGTRVLQFTETDQEFRSDPMIRVFPRMAKCSFHRFGASGTLQRHDAYCILPLNIINEKIYIFLWFWFVILAVLSGLALVYRLATVLLPRFRFTLLRSRARLTNEDDLEIVMEQSDSADWFVMYLLCKNLDATHFRDVMSDYASKLNDEEPLLKRELAGNQY